MELVRVSNLSSISTMRACSCKGGTKTIGAFNMLYETKGCDALLDFEPKSCKSNK